MRNLFWLTEAQMVRLRPFFPKSHSRPRVDDLRVLSGIIFINRNGLRWCDAPREYGSAETLYNRWKRWSDNGVFARIMMGLAAESSNPKTIMIDAAYLKAHRTACRLRAKEGARLPDRSNERRHEHKAACRDRCERADRSGSSGRQDRNGDNTGAAALLGSLPKADWLLAGQGYDADWIRRALQDKGTKACIPGRASRKKTMKYDKRRYTRRDRIGRDRPVLAVIKSESRA
ncbi:IS5 family transposase [Paracoccus sp. (in: a-proteobacteria)]|uniref:IS5 family transposase n=1 Tax=Paracoccus sp. TaxID=267 RepID=UPI00396C76A3